MIKSKKKSQRSTLSKNWEVIRWRQMSHVWCCPLLCSKGIEDFMNGNLMFQFWNGDGLQLPFSFVRWKLTKTLTKIGIKPNEWSHSVARIKNTKILSAAPVRAFEIEIEFSSSYISLSNRGFTARHLDGALIFVKTIEQWAIQWGNFVQVFMRKCKESYLKKNKTKNRPYSVHTWQLDTLKNIKKLSYGD